MRALLMLLAGVIAATANGAAQGQDFPQHLRDTGLYADGSITQVNSTNLPFSPQYPLWSDGASKRRWIHLPPGTFIDASNPDAWQFPPGTKLWKEFAVDRAIETRLIERRADGSWHFATYVWNEDGSDAVLAPARGIKALPVPKAPGGRYAVPGRGDCIACHGGAAAPVLGFAALQLSPARDALAVHGHARSAGELDLRALVERGLLRGLPEALLDEPPRIAAASSVERAALGYLHGNCAHCHHAGAGRVPVRLTLMQRVADPLASAADVLQSMINAPSRFQSNEHADPRIVVPADADASVLTQRMRSRDARVQMPPLGTHHADLEGLALLTRWISHDLAQRKEP